VTCATVPSGSKPRDLVELENESARLRSERMWEAHMRGGDRPGQVGNLAYLFTLHFQ
jgi:hypothetical protein